MSGLLGLVSNSCGIRHSGHHVYIVLVFGIIVIFIVIYVFGILDVIADGFGVIIPVVFSHGFVLKFFSRLVEMFSHNDLDGVQWSLGRMKSQAFAVDGFKFNGRKSC